MLLKEMKQIVKMMDFMIKTKDKNPRYFELPEVIFKCELKMHK